jgi:cobalt/nickel transport protein
VVVRGAATDLLATLRPRELESHPAFTATYELREPGAHVFYVEPAPYYEPDERTYIIHYTKVVVDGFNAWSGWDALVGFPVEIQPLTRPYGLWAGNVFQGVVLHEGKPAPFAHVEVERLNDDKALALPSPVFETQVIKTDGQGVFTYVMPAPGWWGFAALIEGDAPMTTPEGDPASVELGALLWVRAAPMEFTPPTGTGGH